ncbi:MAG: zinc ribbon domain-containing protein [Oscillospiraceae bacterium]|nr:zinc ribbon domain-containing protein [Oscillospiraceae bacterium]
MFCPNCGKDAGEFKFCPYCGTGMPELKAAVWSVGMPCPHCGGTKLEGKECAFCGARLVGDEQDTQDETLDSYDIPYREFVTSLGVSIELKRDELLLKRKWLFRTEKIHIPYSSIAEAEYSRTEGYMGRIRFLWFSAGSSGQFCQEKVMFGGEDACMFFYQVFFVIKQLSPSSAAFVVQCPPVDPDKLARFSQNVDMEALFQRYVPCWEPAADEVMSKCMIPGEEALAFVFSYFEQRQAQLYKMDVRLAARDYNRMMRYRKHDRSEERRKKSADSMFMWLR